MRTLTHHFLRGYLTLQGRPKLYKDWIKDNQSQLKYSSPGKMHRMHVDYWLRHPGYTESGLILSTMYDGVDTKNLIFKENPFLAMLSAKNPFNENYTTHICRV